MLIGFILIKCNFLIKHIREKFAITMIHFVIEIFVKYHYNALSVPNPAFNRDLCQQFGNREVGRFHEFIVFLFPI